MNLKTSSEFYNISILNEDIIEIKNSEKVIWDLHYANNIFDLFKNVKTRTLIFNELFVLYQKHNDDYKKLSDDLLGKYPEIFQIVFKNNYHNILEAFQKLSNLLLNQLIELNVSENLLNEKQREKILNGNKIREDQSEFTTLILLLLDSINGIKENENSNQNLDKKNEDIYLKENQTNLKSDKNLIEENNINSELNLNQSNKNLKEEQIEEVKEIHKQIEIEETLKQDELDDFIFKEEKKENLDETLNELIIKYFAYQDSPEINDDEKKEILKNSCKSNSAKKYAQILLELNEKGELEIYEILAKKLFTETLINLQNYDIEPEKFTLSTSWAMWDIVKQLYYSKNPHKSSNEYKLADPLYDKEKQQEIKDRHVGWIVYKQMTTGRLDNILNKIKHSIYGKRIIEFMIAKPKPGFDSLPSYKLAKLGECIRLGLEE